MYLGHNNYVVPIVVFQHSCVFLHNLLADLKDQWNELHEEDEPDSAPVAEEDSENSSNGIHGM
ncbi:hypothetical protein VP01_9238g1 [Puccinia sorghi]|uniref:Uncharacterized protein n=1 Tax=Puccinia sorghi TaxID=27349 RepID=A0A0L6U7U3_9BASI|nr:hypothetical protein VP01_9238g1 [Puccinia sorghi]